MAKKLPNTPEFQPFSAPDFTLPYEPDAFLSLSDLKDKWTVLFLYPSDDTPTCTQEAREFSHALSDFEALGAVVIGLSKDDLKSHAKFKTKHDLKTLLLSDEDTNLINALGAWVEKSLYGRQYMGTDRSTFLIDPDGLVRYAWRKVRIKGHVEAVLEELKRQQA